MNEEAIEVGYYMVRVRDRGACQKSHLSFEEAKAEAERLCAKEGKPAWVLQAVGVVRPVAAPTEWKDLR